MPTRRRPSPKQRCLISCAAVLLATLPSAQGVAQLATIGELDRELSRLARAEEFAGAVLVARGDEVLLSEGYGLADRETDAPFRADTISTVGSITKQFTGAAILELQEQGRLSVSDSLAQHLDGVPADKAKITLHQLLTHSSGLRDALGSDEDYIGRDAYVAKVWSSKLLFEPGERHEYSNVGYSVLAAIVEARSGRSYEQYLREVFFEPLEMKDTGYFLPEWDLGRVAKGYRGERAYGTVLESQRTSRRVGSTSTNPVFSWHLIGNGGIHSTVADMHRWVRSLRDHRVLSEASTRQLFGEHIDEGEGDSFYGYGWVTFHLADEKRMVGHNGGNGFFFADVNFFPDQSDLMYCILVNDARRSEHVSRTIARTLLELDQ